MSTVTQCSPLATSPAAGSERSASVAARGMEILKRVVDFLERAAAGRRALNQLAGADDRMLKDIGLDRSDLRNAAAEPLYRDPTALLAGRAVEGRTHRPHRLTSGSGISFRYY